MIHIEFQEQDIDRFYHNFLKENHHKIRLKNFALYLKCIGYSHNEINKLCRISKPTLATYIKEFKTEGFAGFEKLKWKGQKSELNSYIDIIDKDFELNPPKTVVEAQERIMKLTGIQRSPTQIRDFLRNKLKYRYLKTGSLPGNGKNDDDEKETERQDFKKKSSNHCWSRQELARR